MACKLWQGEHITCASLSLPAEQIQKSSSDHVLVISGTACFHNRNKLLWSLKSVLTYLLNHSQRRSRLVMHHVFTGYNSISKPLFENDLMHYLKHWCTHLAWWPPTGSILKIKQWQLSYTGKKTVLPLMADKSLLTHAVHHSDLGLADIHFGES